MSAPGASAEHKHSSGLFVREETEIFDFEAGDASEARVNYSGNSRWGGGQVHSYTLDTR